MIDGEVKLEAKDEDWNCGGIGLFIEEGLSATQEVGKSFRLTFYVLWYLGRLERSPVKEPDFEPCVYQFATCKEAHILPNPFRVTIVASSWSVKPMEETKLSDLTSYYPMS